MPKSTVTGSSEPSKAKIHGQNGNIINLNPQDMYKSIFSALDTDKNGKIHKKHIFGVLQENGILESDPRISELVQQLRAYDDKQPIDLPTFQSMCANSISLLERAVRHQLIIPDFAAFRAELEDIFEQVRPETAGRVATYIPQLARIDPEHYAMSVCTVDGQIFSVGESDIPYCVQSTGKPILYSMALKLNGEDKVHEHVGHEPSGQGFNEITLNKRKRPHNPMINAGAIMCCSLIKPDEPLADRLEFVTSKWEKLTGGQRVGFNNAVYHSEKQTADRNFALAHFMREMGAFPPNTDIQETLDFYFQWCAIEVTASQQAIVAATLANGGVCPLTNERVFDGQNVRHCLSMMYSCGMYDFSGEYAFTVGLPAKSGVSGALMIVIPNVGGITIWSPRLDEMGNPVRGVEFSKEMVRRFSFHNYDNLAKLDGKIDPRRLQSEVHNSMTFGLIWAASQGDLSEVRRLRHCGVDLDRGDYDDRTALHLAAAEGHLHVVEYLLSKDCAVSPKDRWGATPLADALKNGHGEVAEALKQKGAEG